MNEESKVIKVFVSREYLEMKNLFKIAIDAAATRNTDNLNKAVLNDAVITGDVSLVSILTAPHFVNFDISGVTYTSAF